MAEVMVRGTPRSSYSGFFRPASQNWIAGLGGMITFVPL